jgi:hypothetical protein
VIVHYGAIPADYRIVEIGLPDGWPGEDSGLDTATYGTEWAASLRSAGLRVPSAAIRVEHNFRTIRFDVPDTEHIDDRLRGSE